MTFPQIVLLTENFPPAVGGSAELFANAYGRVSVPGTHVLAARHPAAPDVEPFGEGGRIERTLIPMKTWGALSREGRAGYRRLRTAVQDAGATGATVVHCGRVLPEGLGALLARRRLGCRFVCWTHGEEIGYLRTSRELRWLARLVHRRAEVLIANCHNTVRLLREFGAPVERGRVIHPGVDCDAFSSASGTAIRERLLGSAGEQLLLTVGRLEARKGHDVTIRAVAELAARGRGIRYAVVGDGRERARLEQLARELRVDDRVSFEGAPPASALPEYYAACDVFVMANRAIGGDVEGFGMVFLEAAAAGKPAIGGRSGGVPEAVEEGSTGLLVGGEDPAELALAIDTLLASKDLRDRMGHAGRARARRDFTWERAASQLADLHREMSESGRGR